MSYGITIKNANNSIIIDGLYKNFYLYESYTNVTIDWVYGQVQQLISFTATNGFPLVVIKPNSTSFYVSGVLGYHKTGDNWDGFYIIVEKHTGSVTIDFKVFLAKDQASAETYGLRIKDSAGGVTFDSGFTYFDLVDVDSITLPNTPTYAPGDGVTITTDISDAYFTLHPLGGWGYGTLDGYLWRWFTGIKRIDSTHIIVNWGLIFKAPFNQNFNDGWNPAMKLLTVK